MGECKARISIHTLHYYDEIGLPKPASYSQNGYRKYGEEELLQLQQILFFRQRDLNLNEIREIPAGPIPMCCKPCKCTEPRFKIGSSGWIA